MKVLKRNGKYQDLSFDKVLYRIRKLTTDTAIGSPLKNIEPDVISQKVISEIHDGISSSSLDEFAAQICINKSVEHLEYADLASRIIISNMHKNTSECFSDVMESVAEKTGLLNSRILDVIRKNKNKLNFCIDYSRDFMIDYFGFKTLEKSYLQKKDNQILERPQHMFLRVSLGIHYEDIESAIETYRLMSQKYFIHASPTLFNAGTNKEQLSSCFLVSTDDSMENIYKTISDCALISKNAGGIGLAISNIRAKGTPIRGTNGTSDGIVPMLKVYNETARYCNQGSRRKGSFACFVEDTKVFTFNDGVKNIQDVVIGDTVVTHKNRIRPVEQVHKNKLENREIFKVSIEGNKDIFVTGNHRFWSKTSSTNALKWHSVKELQAWMYRHNQRCYATTPEFESVTSELTFIKNQQCLRIQAIKLTNRKDNFVYTLGVKEDHSYTVEGIIVENCYLEPWHADTFEFLELRKNNGDENNRARDLFYALYIPDLFMKKVEENSDWHLMCPNLSPGLQELYGEKFEDKYNQYVKEERYIKKIKARDLWQKILISQIETGMPYMVYKDAINNKTNQQNLGTLKLSNLCAEVAIYSDFKDEEIGVCNISTLGLPMYVTNNNEFDFKMLEKVARIATRNLNRVIDTNYYPVYQTRNSNQRHRPIIVGIQGLYDTFMKMKIPFESKEANILNSKIMEVIYYACLSESNELSKKEGPYSSFQGSPMSKGIFQFEMWGVKDTSTLFLGKNKWEELRQSIIDHGLRNSLVTALPPTASTSQILGNIESFEPMTSNFFTRTTLSGTFPIINKYLMKDLMDIGLWSLEMKNTIMRNNGSIQSINEIPDNLKLLYKTIWEIPQKCLIDLSAERGKFVDHSQSLNIFMATPNYQKLSSMHMYGWKKGLKTGMYYLRSKPASKAEQFTITTNTKKQEEILACSLDNREACESCSG